MTPDTQELTPRTRSSPDLVSAAFQADPRGLALVDAEGTVLAANPAFSRAWATTFHAPVEAGQPLSAGPGAPTQLLQRLRLRLTSDGEAAPLEAPPEWRFSLTRLPDSQGWLLGLEPAPSGTAAALAQEIAALREGIRTRDLLLSLISHDLRSPIAQVNANLYLLRANHDFASPAKSERHLRELQDNVQSLADELENLLRWAQVQRHGLQVRAETLDPFATISAVVDLLRPLAQRKKQRLDIQAQPGLRLDVDREMLAFAVRNFLANAIKFTPLGGHITLSQTVADGVYRFSVRDTGVGMSAEAIQRVLTPGVHYHSCGTEGEKGLGLGLDLAQTFARQLGGHLDIRSTPGSGTEVALHLPLPA